MLSEADEADVRRIARFEFLAFLTGGWPEERPDTDDDELPLEPDPIDSRPQVGDIVQITAASSDPTFVGRLIYVQAVLPDGSVAGSLVGSDHPNALVPPGEFHVVGAAAVALPVVSL